MEQTPREYAIELVNEYENYVNEFGFFGDNRYTKKTQRNNAKQCAAISIKKTINYAKTFGDVALQDIQYFETALKELETL